MTTHFFLGANSGEGFQNLYSDITERKDTYDLLALKGGPGVGKSTFMKQIAKAAEAAGTDVEYIRCSGDPDSLDAVLLPACKTIVVDGTAPHVIEPKFPAAIDRYVNLGQFYDIAAIKKARTEIVSRTESYQAAYQRAFHCLKAARQVELDANAHLQATMDTMRADRRITGIIAREFHRKTGRIGTLTCRFLGSATHKGYVWCFDTVEALCPRIYELADRSELGAGALLRLQNAAMAAGHDVIACLNPEDMSCLQHLLVPTLGLAFVTSNEWIPYNGKPYRRIRLDAMAEARDRPRVRFARRMTEALREEAVGALKEAKTEHDVLESIYNPYVDFDGVRALAAQETARILGYLQG